MASKTKTPKVSAIKEIKTKTGIVFFNEPRHSFYRTDRQGNTIRIKSVTKYSGNTDKGGLVYWACDLMGEKLLKLVRAGEKITEADILDAEDEHVRGKQKAADIGTLIHNWIEAYLTKQNPEMPEDPNAIIGINSFLEWESNNKVKWLENEQLIYYRKGNHEFAGKFDAVAKIGKEIALIDFKSSNDLHDEYAFQTAAYQMAWEQMHDKKIDYRLVIRFSKVSETDYWNECERKNDKRVAKGKEKKQFAGYKIFEPKEYRENDEDKEAFLGLVCVLDRQIALTNFAEE